MNSRRYAAGLFALVLVVVAALVVPWGVPVGLWTWPRVSAHVGDRAVSLVRNAGNGMAGVASLGSIDGMLFEISGGRAFLQMSGVGVPLDVGFFTADGELVDIQRMEVCTTDPCPPYTSAHETRWVIETPVGQVGWTIGDRLVFD